MLLTNTTTMRAMFQASIFLRLSQESQQKVEMIYEIANMLAHYQQPQLTTEEFDLLYDKTVNDLGLMSAYIRSQCHNAVYPEIEGE